MEPARVMHVITRMIVGGAQRNTLETAARLDAKRYHADVVCGPQTGPEGSLHAEARARGVALHIVPSLRRKLRPLGDLRALVALTRRMRRDRPALVHTHSSKAGILGRWAARLAGVPVVIHTVHGWGFHEGQPRWVAAAYRWLERTTARGADVLVTVSNADRAAGLAVGIGTPAQYRLIRSAIDISRPSLSDVEVGALRTEWGVAANARVVGSVGRLAPQKDPIAFVELAAQVCAQRPDAQFVWLGDGPLRAAVEARIASRGLAGRITLAGLQADADRQLGAFDVLVSTSRWEGLPRVLVEALLAGVPVVASEIPAHREALADGRFGRLVPAGAGAAWAEAVCAVLDGPLSPHRADAQAWVRREFALPHMLAELDSLYAALLERATRESA